MKLTLPLTALVAILGLAMASTPVKAQAAPATTPAPASTPAPAKAKKTQYSGTLSAIDTTANTITVTSTSKKNGDQTLVIAVASTTVIKRDGKKATLADFKTGEKATGSYTTDGTTLTAATLNFRTAKAKAPKTTTTATTPAPATPAAPAAQ
jgi:hypothetical protein